MDLVIYLDVNNASNSIDYLVASDETMDSLVIVVLPNHDYVDLVDNSNANSTSIVSVFLAFITIEHKIGN